MTPSRTARGWLALLAVTALAAVLLGIALIGTTARHDAASTLTIALLYLLLAAAAWGVAGWLHARGRLGTWAAAFALAFLVVWQLREATYLPPSIVEALAAALLFAAVLRPLLRRLLGDGRDAITARVPRPLVLALAALLALGAVGATVFHGRPLTRWHLLRHHTLLGTPAHYLLDPSVREVEQDLFAAHDLADAAAVIPPAPARRRIEVAPAATPPPNVVFVLLDTLRADALAPARGDAPPRMPKLEARATRAVTLTDLRVNASWTRPSMGSFFTGLLPEEHGARDTDEALPERCETIAELFRAAGWSTAAIVSNVAALGADAGFAQGFEVYDEVAGNPFARAPEVNRHLRAWLAKRPTDRPHFLYLHYLDAHEPYAEGMPRRRAAAPYRRAYDGALRALDDELDQALAMVEAALGPNTLVVVTSDHGEELFEHEHFGHGHSLYRELLHVPALLWTVGARPETAPGTVEARLDSRDLHALLEAVAGGELPDVRTWAASRHRVQRYASLYYSTEGRLVLRPYLARTAMRAVEEADVELLWSGYGDTFELYDLRVDPAETRNLAAARPDEVARLQPALDTAVRFWTRAEGYRASAEARQQMKSLGYAD